MGEFENLSKTQQRNILGEMFFPVVHKISPKFAPKITGMLIDLEVSTIEEILSLLKDDQMLKDRVKNAEVLLMAQEMKMLNEGKMGQEKPGNVP